MMDTPNEPEFTAEQVRNDPQMQRDIRDEAIFSTLVSVNAQSVERISTTMLDKLREGYLIEQDASVYAEMIVGSIDAMGRFLVGVAFNARDYMRVNDPLPVEPELEEVVFKCADIDMLPEMLLHTVEVYYHSVVDQQQKASVVDAITEMFKKKE